MPTMCPRPLKPTNLTILSRWSKPDETVSFLHLRLDDLDDLDGSRLLLRGVDKPLQLQQQQPQ